MKYTLGSNYSAAGTQVVIPDKWLNQARLETQSLKGAIDKWLFENGYMTEEELRQEQERTVMEEKPTSRKRKADDTKRALIASLYAHLSTLDDLENIEVTNVERIIAFSLGEDKYEVTLSKKRKAKTTS